jgi:hypothetical protein
MMRDMSQLHCKYFAVLFITTACLPLQSRKWNTECSQNGQCDNLSSAIYGRMPPLASRQDETDSIQKERIRLLEAEDGIHTLLSEQQNQCRNIYELNDIYVLPQGQFSRGAPWILGGASLTTTGLVMMSNDNPNTEVSPGLSLGGMGLGLGFIGYGTFIHRLQSTTRIEYIHEVKGEFAECGDWLPQPSQEIDVLLPAPSNSDFENIHITLVTDKDGRVTLPSDLFSALRLTNPELISTHSENSQVVHHAYNPSSNNNLDWICGIIEGFDSLYLPGDDSNKWELRFSYADKTFSIPWLQNSGQDFFTEYKSDIQQCSRQIRTKFSRLVSKEAAGSSDNTTDIQNLVRTSTRVRSSSSRSNRNQGAGESNTMSLSSSSASQLDENTTIILGRAQNIAGSYRCSSGSRKANLNIRQDGNFVLMVELDTGTAYGICSDIACGIQGISGTAMAFTQGLKRFRIRQDGENVILNESVNCSPRRRR